MTKSTSLRAGLAFLIFLLENLQAWDSHVQEAGLLVVLLVSLAIPLLPIALLVLINQKYMVGALVLSVVLLVVARLISPIPLPGLFIILVPAVMGLVFAGVTEQKA
jgi:hypothetical protein